MASTASTNIGNHSAADARTKARAAAKKAPTVVPHLTLKERAARGEAARAEVPRSSHGVFEPSPTRPDPVELLDRQAKTRVPEPR